MKEYNSYSSWVTAVTLKYGKVVYEFTADIIMAKETGTGKIVARYDETQQKGNIL